MVWELGNYQIASLKAIPNHVVLSKGDTITTTGYSSVYPEGELIGVIEDFDLPEGNNFYNINIKFQSLIEYATTPTSALSVPSFSASSLILSPIEIFNK